MPISVTIEGFTLRCKSQKITPTSLKVKSNIRTLRGKRILQRAEKQLADEWIRSINNTIEVCTCRRDIFMEEHKGQISVYYFKECCEFIKVRECRHKTTLERHLRKFHQLFQQTRGVHSKNQQYHTCMAPTTALTPEASTSPITSSPSVETTATTVQSNKWVKNLSEVPLTEAQVSLLAHGTNFAIAPRNLPLEYITAVEQACLNLEPHNAEELRAEIRRALRHVNNPRRNITKEAQALAELKKDHSSHPNS